jgi:hypothetical protein
MPGMVGDPGHLLDHGGDARQGPVVGVEAVGAGTLAQRLVDGGKLGIRQARGGSGGAGAAQPLQPARLSLGVPAADVLAGDAQPVGDLGSGVAGGKQGTGLHAGAFERLAVTQTAGVAAVGGWSHAAMLPGQPPDHVIGTGEPLYNSLRMILRGPDLPCGRVVDAVGDASTMSVTVKLAGSQGSISLWLVRIPERVDDLGTRGS